MICPPRQLCNSIDEVLGDVDGTESKLVSLHKILEGKCDVLTKFESERIQFQYSLFGVAYGNNYPLFIQTIYPELELKFHYIVHTCLDVIEEKALSPTKSNTDLRELYLGLLYPTEDYKVYGYVTNTKVKIVLVVESSNTNLRDNEIRGMFHKLHKGYTDMMCNPFYVPGEPVNSKYFTRLVASLMKQD